jgi:hypothetical protein
VKKGIVAIVVLGLLGLGVGRLLRGAGATRDRVATFTVEKTRFERRVMADGNLRAVKATTLAAPTAGEMEPMKIAWIAQDGMPVKKGDVVVKFDRGTMEKRLRDAEADLAAANAKLAAEGVKSKAAVADRETDAELAGDELAEQRKFQSKDQEIFSRNQIIEAEIDEKLADAKQDHATKAEVIEKHLSSSNAAVIVVERKKAEIAIAHAKNALASMEVVSPGDGLFVLRRDWRGQMSKVGDSMWPGQQIGEIPLVDDMEAEVFVLEVEGTGLAENQPATIVVEARPDRSYEGKIRLVDKLAQPRQHGSPVQYFAVAVALAKTDKDVMKPGSRVQATLILDQEDALVVPRQAVVAKDGKNIVYRQSGSGFDAVSVELGASTSGRVVITKGLTAGDVIALRDPTHDVDDSGSAEAPAKAAP